MKCGEICEIDCVMWRGAEWCEIVRVYAVYPLSPPPPPPLPSASSSLHNTGPMSQLQTSMQLQTKTRNEYINFIFHFLISCSLESIDWKPFGSWSSDSKRQLVAIISYLIYHLHLVHHAGCSFRYILSIFLDLQYISFFRYLPVDTTEAYVPPHPT